MALIRIINIQGTVRQILSDNATCYRGSERVESLLQIIYRKKLSLAKRTHYVF